MMSFACFSALVHFPCVIVFAARWYFSASLWFCGLASVSRSLWDSACFLRVLLLCFKIYDIFSEIFGKEARLHTRILELSIFHARVRSAPEPPARRDSLQQIAGAVDSGAEDTAYASFPCDVHLRPEFDAFSYFL